jgi:hypothetical protein
MLHFLKVTYKAKLCITKQKVVEWTLERGIKKGYGGIYHVLIPNIKMIYQKNDSSTLTENAFNKISSKIFLHGLNIKFVSTFSCFLPLEKNSGCISEQWPIKSLMEKL